MAKNPQCGKKLYLDSNRIVRSCILPKNHANLLGHDWHYGHDYRWTTTDTGGVRWLKMEAGPIQEEPPAISDKELIENLHTLLQRERLEWSSEKANLQMALHHQQTENNALNIKLDSARVCEAYLKFTEKDYKAVKFIYDRLALVHKENINYGYMLNLAEVINKIQELAED